MNRRTEPFTDLLPAVVADLAARHTTNGAAMTNTPDSPIWPGRDPEELPAAGAHGYVIASAGADDSEGPNLWDGRLFATANAAASTALEETPPGWEVYELRAVADTDAAAR